MYKPTPITKKAGSPLYNALVDNDRRNIEKGKKDVSIDIIGKSTKKGKPGKEGEEKTRTYTYDDMRANGATEAEIEAAKKHNEEKYGTQNPTKEGLANNTIGTGDFEPDEPGTPDETNYSATEIFRQDFGTNVGDLENREMNRVIKKAEKDVRRGKIKSARSEAKGYTVNEDGEAVETKAGKLKGKAKRDFMKKARQKAKAEERSAETKAFKDRASNAAAGQASGKGLDSAYRRDDVAKTKGDFSDKVQLANADLEKEMNASSAEDTKRNSASINFNTDVDQYKSAGMQNVKMRDFASEFGAKNVALSAAKMRAPLKKNYFKK